MTGTQKLIVVKSIHTAIWCFFNVVIFYLLFAVIVDHIDRWFWIGLGLVAAEAVVLVAFRMSCPLTVLARRYTNSSRANFDIYLPEWIARHNKTIYGLIMVVVIGLLLVRSVTR